MCILTITKVNLVYTISEVYEMLRNIQKEDSLQNEGEVLLQTLINRKNILMSPTPERNRIYIEKIK